MRNCSMSTSVCATQGKVASRRRGRISLFILERFCVGGGGGEEHSDGVAVERTLIVTIVIIVAIVAIVAIVLIVPIVTSFWGETQ